MSYPQLSEAKSGVPIRYLVYPHGDYGDRVIDAMIIAGYDDALVAWGGAPGR